MSLEAPAPQERPDGRRGETTPESGVFRAGELRKRIAEMRRSVSGIFSAVRAENEGGTQQPEQ